MEFLNTLSSTEITLLYIIAPAAMAILFCMILKDKGRNKAILFSFCSVGFYFPIFNTIINEIEDVMLAVKKAINTKFIIVIIMFFVSIAIIGAITIGWVCCIDATYQLLFPKKEKKNIKQKINKKRHKVRHL